MKYNFNSTKTKEVGYKFYRNTWESDREGTLEDAVQYLKTNFPKEDEVFNIYGVPIRFHLKKFSIDSNNLISFNFGINEDSIETKDGPAFLYLSIRCDDAGFEEQPLRDRFVFFGSNLKTSCYLSFKTGKRHSYILEEYTHGTVSAKNPFTISEFILEMVKAFKEDVHEFARRINKASGIKESKKSLNSKLSSLIEELKEELKEER